MTPLVLIHGFTGSPASWRRVRESLSSVPVALTPTLLGHAGGPNGQADTDFEGETDRLATLARRAEAGPLHLVGYSLGARLGLGLLVRHPELFAAATLIGVHPGLETPAERSERARAERSWCELLETRGIEAFADAWQAQLLFATQSRVPAAWLAEQHRVRLSHHPAKLACSLRSLGLANMPCYREELAQISAPVNLVVGERDQKFRALAADMVSQLPNATLCTLAAVGHNPVLECPDRVARLLEQGAVA